MIISIQLDESQTNEVKTHLESAFGKEFTNDKTLDLFSSGMFDLELSRVIIKPLINLIDNYGENMRIYKALEENKSDE